MIIWAGSWPRSGSTLFRIVWHTYTGLPTYSYANDPILAKPALDPYVGQKKLPVAWDKMGQRFDTEAKIYLIKTHFDSMAVDPNNTMRKILIVRDARAAIVSLAYYTSWRKKRRFQPELRRIIQQARWVESIKSWLPVSQAVVQYERLQSEPQSTLVKVLDSLEIELPLRERKMPEFRMLHNVLPLFFREGIEGGWRNVLTVAQEAAIWKKCGEQMEQLGYER